MSPQLSAMTGILKDRGVRLTAERRVILRGIHSCGGHFDADTLLDHFRRRGDQVSRATVYRTLGTLVELGLLRKIEMGDRQSLYEPAEGREHHEHLICVRCGEIIEFVEPEIERLQEEVCLRSRFTPLDHTLQIYGICHTCNCEDVAETTGTTGAGR